MNDIDIPKDPQARRAWIQYQLKLRGYSLAALGREMGVERNTVYTVFRWPYPRMERAIAERLNLRPEQLWPERYTPQGDPARSRGRQKSTHKHDTAPAPKSGNGKKREVS